MPTVYVPKQGRDWTNAKLLLGGMLLGCVLVPLFIAASWLLAAFVHGGTP